MGKHAGKCRTPHETPRLSGPEDRPRRMPLSLTSAMRACASLGWKDMRLLRQSPLGFGGNAAHAQAFVSVQPRRARSIETPTPCFGLTPRPPRDLEKTLRAIPPFPQARLAYPYRAAPEIRRRTSRHAARAWRCTHPFQPPEISPCHRQGRTPSWR